jgi:glycosidase
MAAGAGRHHCLVPAVLSLASRDDGASASASTDVRHARDVRTFVKAAHERGLRVITELVINHT